MATSNAKHAKAYRQRQREKLEAMEAGLRAIEKFGHGDGHGRGWTCADMAEEALSQGKTGI